MPSPDSPLIGGCACGAVRFEGTAPFTTGGHCHCKRCQRRSGALWSFNASVPADGFTITAGEEQIRTWTPPDGLPKTFCAVCGGHLYSVGDGVRGVRLGAVDGDPEVRPPVAPLARFGAGLGAGRGRACRASRGCARPSAR